MTDISDCVLEILLYFCPDFISKISTYQKSKNQKSEMANVNIIIIKSKYFLKA